MNVRMIDRACWLSAFCAFCGLLFCVASADAARLFPAPPEWVKDQTVYEVNLRQFSADGTVAGLQTQLPRLKKLGVGILWIMPVNPIGVEGRSGTLGSPYAVRDYIGFNNEYGTVEQFKAMIADAHAAGMHVIIDWVACHSALDNVWVKAHADWYKHDEKGQLVHPVADWKDVAALDYGKPAMRQAMIAAMMYWVREVGVDGFRCDTAEWVPLDFWCDARDALRAIKPVYLLAEGNKPELMEYAFDSAYAWDLLTNMVGIVKGEKNAEDLGNYISAERHVVPGGRFRLNYTSNHDKNSWEGTTQEQLGNGVKAFTVLTFTLPGLPLIYNGQEAGTAEHRLAFFERDPIVWREDPMAGLYAKLSTMRDANAALRVGPHAEPVQFLKSISGKSVLAFERATAEDRVVVLLNLGNQPAEVATPANLSRLHEIVGDGATTTTGDHISLQPWDVRVWATHEK